MEEREQQQEVVWVQVPMPKNAFPHYGAPYSAPPPTTQYDRKAHARERPRDEKGRFVSENPPEDRFNTWDDGFYNHKTMRFVQDREKPWIWKRTHDLFTIEDWLILAGLLGLIGWAIIRSLFIL